MSGDAEHDSAIPRDSEGPNYDVEIQADELLADLADDAADYGEDYEEKRSWWHDSFRATEEFHEARYWMLEAVGGRRAYRDALTRIQPGGRFRNGDGKIDVRGYMRWLSNKADHAHEDSRGPYTETRQASEAESAYVSILSTLRDDYGVGWPRLDDIGGNPIEVDLP